MPHRTATRLAGQLLLPLGAVGSGPLGLQVEISTPTVPATELVPLISGSVAPEPRVWHAVNVDFSGPTVAESDESNPFKEYRLDAIFVHEASGDTVTRPGFFATDGHAAESSADSGNVWRVTFASPHAGRWTYAAALSRGAGAALQPALDNPATATGAAVGTFDVKSTTATAPALRTHGALHHDGTRYLKFSGSGRAFLKLEHGSPENTPD